MLSPELRDEIVAHLRQTLPLEGVGLLAVAQPAGTEPWEVGAFYPGTNQDRSPTRYTMDPDEVLHAFLDIERGGGILGAIVHSHPVGPASPSHTDIEEFQYSEALMVIVSLAGDAPDIQAWWLGDPTAPSPAQVAILCGTNPQP